MYKNEEVHDHKMELYLLGNVKLVELETSKEAVQVSINPLSAVSDVRFPVNVRVELRQVPLFDFSSVSNTPLTVKSGTTVVAPICTLTVPPTNAGLFQMRPVLSLMQV